jgi:hypothetical protein
MERKKGMAVLFAIWIIYAMVIVWSFSVTGCTMQTKNVTEHFETKSILAEIIQEGDNIVKEVYDYKPVLVKKETTEDTKTFLRTLARAGFGSQYKLSGIGFSLRPGEILSEFVPSLDAGYFNSTDMTTPVIDKNTESLALQYSDIKFNPMIDGVRDRSVAGGTFKDIATAQPDYLAKLAPSVTTILLENAGVDKAKAKRNGDIIKELIKTMNK